MSKEKKIKDKKFLRWLKKFFHEPIVQKILMGLGLLITVLAVIILIFNLLYADKIFPKTYIGKINFGGQTKENVRQILSQRTQVTLNSETNLQFEDKTWTLKSSDLEMNYNLDATTQLVWGVGREGSLAKILKEQIKAIFARNQIRASFSYNQIKLNDFLANIATQIDIPEKDATIVIQDLQPIIQPEKIGRKVNLTQNIHQIINHYNQLTGPTKINLVVDKIQPKITQNGALEAQATAKEILDNTITLKTNDKTYTLNPADLADWLEFQGVNSRDRVVGESNQNNNKINLNPGNFLGNWVLVPHLREDKIQQFVSAISQEINQPAQDAKFSVQAGRVSTFQISQTGFTLDQVKTVQMISEAVLKSQSEITLPIKVTQPEITSNSAEELGLKEMVGEGKTSWKGSPSNRIHNLTLGASKISGTIVKPGEEFSTVKTIGEIDAAAGFLPELVIKNSTQVVPEYGGGLCQVSTTLFRVVLNSGLKITDRTPHSFRVSYYEPPVGMDATIYDPAPDFKFINNMKTPILIWGEASNNGLVFQIYGTKDGRVVNISDPVVGGYVSPPAAVYTESPTMEPGAIRQVERATAGATASFTYKVTSAAGEVLQSETYTSKYVALPNSYLVGPGYVAPPPPPEEGQ